jgi:hypothetical protein
MSKRLSFKMSFIKIAIDLWDNLGYKKPMGFPLEVQFSYQNMYTNNRVMIAPLQITYDETLLCRFWNNNNR